MDILSKIRYGGQEKLANAAMETISRPETISEMLESQIKYHENKIKDLKEAKAAISPDVERALNALSKL